MEKKASEILVEIQGDIKSLKKTVELLNFQYSMVLERLNSINNRIGAGNLGAEPVKMPETSPVVIPPISGAGGTVTSPESPPIANMQISDGETAPTRRKQIPQKEFDFNETVMDNDSPAALGDGMEDITTEDIEDKTSSNANVPVTQVLYTPLGKPMTLAKIEVIDPKGTVVQKTRTNSAGRWQALLAPGAYQTHVIRRYNNKIIDFTQDIKVGASSGGQVEIVPPEDYQKKRKDK